jgi:non-canonical purine NTP pyrophosphatase (RdgB/HAM1 family)
MPMFFHTFTATAPWATSASMCRMVSAVHPAPPKPFIEKVAAREMKDKKGYQRRAKFVCVSAIARQGRAAAVTSDFAQGVLTEEPRGHNGFGYDPIFLFPELDRTYAELTNEEKNIYSHRGKAFRRMLSVMAGK